MYAVFDRWSFWGKNPTFKLLSFLLDRIIPFHNDELKICFFFFFRMNEYDKRYFPADVRNFEWDSFCYNYNLGLLRYIGKDNLNNFEPARRRMRKFRIAHFFVLIFYYTLLALFYFYLGRLIGVNQSISTFVDCIKNMIKWNGGHFFVVVEFLNK